MMKISQARKKNKDNRLEIAIGRLVKETRENLDLSIVALAEQAGISPAMLSKIERGKTCSLTKLHEIAKALNVSISSFFRPYEKMPTVCYIPAGKGIKFKGRGTRAVQKHLL